MEAWGDEDHVPPGAALPAANCEGVAFQVDGALAYKEAQEDWAVLA